MLADIHLDDLGGVPVASVRGEVDMSNAQEFGATLQNAVEHVSAGLVIDFSTTEYLDSAGLHFVFELGKRLRDRGQRLHLVVPAASPLASVLEIVNIESLAPCSPTLDEALEKLRDHAADVPPAEPA
jgi:anti-anti-sigma factor